MCGCNVAFEVLSGGSSVARGWVQEDDGDDRALISDAKVAVVRVGSTVSLLEELLVMLGLEDDVRLSLPIEVRISFSRPEE